MTRELAWAAASDAADRNARKHGRKRWSREDLEVAATEFDRLWPVALDACRDPGPQALQFLEVPTVA